MRMKLHINSLFFKIASTVMIGIMLLAVLEGVVNIMVSKTVFVNTFAESQEKIFEQIDSEFYDFYSDMTTVMNEVSANSTMEEYLQGQELSGVAAMQQSYNLERQFENSRLKEYHEAGLFAICKNGRSYIYSNSDRFAVSKEEILDSDIARKAMNNQDRIICQYQDQGFTSVTSRDPVVIMTKAWGSEYEEDPGILAFITIKEEDIRRMYSHFTVDTSDIIILNQDNEVISSDNKEYFNEDSKSREQLNRAVQKMEEEDICQTELSEDGVNKTFLIQRLQSTDYKIVGTIDLDAAFWKEYRIWDMILLTAVIMIVTVFMIFVFIRQQTKPLGLLAMTMKNSEKTQFKEHVSVKGTDEVRQLSETYNEMVDELGEYIARVISIEQDKRSAEIHALQMQINPHYMYNTLASIKWLIWQGDTGKSTAVIDAFISLLRNTVSNTDEFITVGQEIENLKNYVLINHARYGEKVQVEYFVLPQCMDYRVPKLILQPFVENAFFHAFPEGRSGHIRIFVKEEGENLRFDITDDGAGMTTDQLTALTRGERPKSEHFTGIGIGNVDERIKLIYGMDYGINILSEEEKGTTVILLLRKDPFGS